MRDQTPSRTAAFVAVARAMAARLPPEGQLALDPYGAAFEDGPRAALQRALDRAHVPVHRLPMMTGWLLYMQVRTRAIDDAVRAFVERGGTQVVLLGAGYDTRALRLPELAGARVFEVDHPATQARKRRVLEQLGAQSPSHYLSWNFERAPMAELPGALAAGGHDPGAPTFTIWEGVTMYLTDGAIDASLRAIRAFSPPGSQLAMTYFTKQRMARPSLVQRAMQAVVARFGEPWRFGWEPSELPRYLADRGFELDEDRSMSELARELLPPRLARQVNGEDRHIAFAASPESLAVANRM
jgi:methyltransferase (TIGR00027 family)